MDPGVFKVISATGNDGQNPCANIPFTVGAPSGPAGEVTLTPTQTVFLGPATGPLVARSCVVNLVLRAFQMPTNPTTPGTGQTTPLARAEMVGTVRANFDGDRDRLSCHHLEQGHPGVATTSNPNSSTVVPGTSVTDTVTVTKAPGGGPATGSVRFILCQPGVSTPSGCPRRTRDPSVRDIPLTATGTGGHGDFRGDQQHNGDRQYCWRALYLGDANYNATEHTDGVAECFTTVKQPPTLGDAVEHDGGQRHAGQLGDGHGDGDGRAGAADADGDGDVVPVPAERGDGGQGCVSGGTQIGPVRR